MNLEIRPSQTRWLWTTTLAICAFSFFETAHGQTELATVSSPTELKKLSLEQLMDLEITSVSRRPEKLSESASAIQVITQGEIHRSGATSLPEALRLAPNLEVAQVNSHDWAISARGFNNNLANKLLVMIDGRSIYTPLDAGVFWDAQSVMLEDIDRIEVISGPGGTLWGANAVNGVINIISKSAKDTQGALVSGGGGSLLQDFGAVRYGGAAGTNFFYRVYGQRFDRNSTVLANGKDGRNAWDMTQGGFRTDWYPSEDNILTVQGDSYSGSEQGVTRDTTIDGQNVLGRWTRVINSESDLQVQLYFDRTWRRVPGSFADNLRTYDVDLQHHFPFGDRQSITWGAGYRLMEDQVENIGITFLPSERNLQLFSSFVQDEISLIPEQLRFTVGSKFEHNDYSGFEFQPSARLAWSPTDRQTIWGAVSRAVRSPSRIDSDFLLSSPTLTLSRNPDFDSEKLTAYELGYHLRAHDKVSISISSYYNFYDDLRSVDRIGSATNIILANDFKGETWGIELGATYEVTEQWRLRGGYNFLHKKLQPTSPSALPSVREGNDPENQFLIQSITDLPSHFQFDIVARYVDTLENPIVPSYFTFDARLGWEYKNWEIALMGQNLWDEQHPEFGAAASRQEIPRSIFGKVTWRY